MSNHSRVQPGVPTGGQFAPTSHAESDVTLAPATSRFFSDGRKPDPDADYPEGTWRAYGFDATQAHRWAGHGFNQPEASNWQGYGFGPSESAAWRRNYFTPSQARSWQDAAVTQPHVARAWADAGFDPEQDADWMRFGSGMGVTEATAFRDDGWPLEEARPWARHGFTHQKAQEWTDTFPDIAARSASIYQQRGETPASMKAAAPTAPDPLKVAGPFRTSSITVLKSGGGTKNVEARIVGGTLGVHKAVSGNGWAITHVVTGRSLMPAVDRKQDAETIARTLAVADPSLYAETDMRKISAASSKKVWVRDRWVVRGHLPRIIKESITNPNSTAEQDVQYLVAHPIGSDPLGMIAGHAIPAGPPRPGPTRTA